jgi:amino-acid N-acetyltransferase
MIEKACMADAPSIQALINGFADRELMLPRSLHDVYESLRDFVVFRRDGEVLGCCALHISWHGLGEIRSLAVAEGAQRQGIGGQLVESCLAEARQLGMERVFVLTTVPAFFQRFGFVLHPKEKLPHKVWADCIHCPKFPDCDEVALLREL